MNRIECDCGRLERVSYAIAPDRTGKRPLYIFFSFFSFFLFFFFSLTDALDGRPSINLSFHFGRRLKERNALPPPPPPPPSFIFRCIFSAPSFFFPPISFLLGPVFDFIGFHWRSSPSSSSSSCALRWALAPPTPFNCQHQPPMALILLNPSVHSTHSTNECVGRRRWWWWWWRRRRRRRRRIAGRGQKRKETKKKDEMKSKYNHEKDGHHPHVQYATGLLPAI